VLAVAREGRHTRRSGHCPSTLTGPPRHQGTPPLRAVAGRQSRRIRGQSQPIQSLACRLLMISSASHPPVSAYRPPPQR